MQGWSYTQGVIPELGTFVDLLKVYKDGKRSLEDRKHAQKHLIASKMILNPVKDVKVTLSQLVRFIQDMEGSKCKLDLRGLVQGDRIQRFITFFGSRAASNTTANRCKDLTLFCQWLLERKDLLDEWTTIQATKRFLRHRRNVKRQQYQVEKNSAKTDAELLAEGQWLTKEELQQLYVKLLKNLSEVNPSSAVTKKQAREFQKNLLTLCIFALGGQRLELVLSFTILNITKNLEEEYLLKPPREKVIRANCFGGVPVPTYLGRLFFFFKEHIRPLLVSKEVVLSMWINRRGNPMEDGTFRSLLLDIVKRCLGQRKKITLIAFRRIIPSLIWDDDITILGLEPDTFLTHYAGLVNTSKRVLKEHYIRLTCRKKQQKLIQAIEDSLFDTPESKMLKRKLTAQNSSLSNKRIKIQAISANPTLLKLQRMQMENARLKRLLFQHGIKY